MRIPYRPEIDGLRAIAVLSVIFYHANFALFNKNLFSGGFLGVDIFFVVSGYLITSIILKEIYATNSFSFANFYERRVRRIIPALLFVMLFSLPFAYIILFSLKDFVGSIVTSIFFVSNIYFWITGNQYGAEHTLLKPFLHTWSLSIEEQFYIIFPILFYGFKNYRFFFLSIFFFLSLFFSIWSVNTDLVLKFILFKADSGPKVTLNFFLDSNFYLLTSRLFELLLGSLLSYFKFNNWYTGRKSCAVLNQTLPTLGILLIFFSIFFFNDRDLLPSFYTLIPLSGVCLIIWSSNKNEIVTKILSNKIFIFFGLISYSLYLFHYPIFAFARTLEIFNNYYKILFIFLTVIISVLSYYFIERPFRNKNIISFKKILIIIFSSVIILIFFSIYVIKDDGIKKRVPEIFQTKLRETNIKFYQKENLPKVVLIGDSHAGSLDYYLNDGLKNNNLSLFRFDTAMYLKNFNVINKETKKIIKEWELIERNNKIDKFLIENSNLTVVFHQRWTTKILETYFDNEEGYKEYHRQEEKFTDYFEPVNIKTTSQQQREKYIIEGLVSQINNIINQGHQLILVYPVPETGFNPPKLLYIQYIKKYLFNKSQFQPEILTTSYDLFKKRNKIIFEILDSVQSSNIYRVYPHSYFCDKQVKNRCVANDIEHLYYYDDDHLSLRGSKYVVDDIIKIVQKIEANKKNNS